MPRKATALLVSMIGLLAMGAGFLLYASNAIPYQDATPEMLASQASSANRWLALSASGALVTVGGALLWFKRTGSKNMTPSK